MTRKILLGPEINEWVSNLDTALPIRGSDIPGFRAWVNGNGFYREELRGHSHMAFDFGAYLHSDGSLVLGLPTQTPVRAVADGVVKYATRGEWGAYSGDITVEHGADDSGMRSQYSHVAPSIREGERVRKGDVLATLHKDPGNEEGRLVHLHFSLLDGWGTHGTAINGGGEERRLQDPGLIDSSIYNRTIKQEWEPTDPQKVGAKRLRIAHFAAVKIGDFVWTQ